jgi:hypothetical protein
MRMKEGYYPDWGMKTGMRNILDDGARSDKVPSAQS